MQTYADVCKRMQTYADVCRRMLTNALRYAALGRLEYAGGVSHEKLRRDDLRHSALAPARVAQARRVGRAGR